MMDADGRPRCGLQLSARPLLRTAVLAAAGSVAAATTALLFASAASAATPPAPAKTTLRVVALKAPIRVTLDRAVPVSVTVTNRGKKTVPAVALRLSVGLLPDPGFKITWATARSGPLKPGASRTFAFRIKIASRHDRDHTEKVSGQTLSFYGAGTYVIEACPGRTPSTDEACRESRTITAT